MKEIPVLITVEEAQKYLHIGRVTILKLIHKKEIPAKKIGKAYMIKREDLIGFIEKTVD